LKITYIIAELMIEYSVNMSKQNDIVIEKPEKKKKDKKIQKRQLKIVDSIIESRISIYKLMIK